MSQLKPFYKNVRAHYDLSNDFYRLFLDPTMTYSCALWQRDGMSLEEAQVAKLDAVLDRADIQPGHRVLDIGFGWGSCVRRTAERFDVDVVGLTLSENQHQYVSQMLADNRPRPGRPEVRIQGWEEFEEPVDRIVSIEVFEHFRRERYDAFFRRCFELMPDDGRLVLQTSMHYEWPTLRDRGIELTHENVLFGKFIRDVIFPGGELCEPKTFVEYAERAGFKVTEQLSLRDHYVPTLDLWAANLEAHRDEAIELTSQEVYDRYMYYLTGCSKHFASGHIDVLLFTCCKN